MTDPNIPLGKPKPPGPSNLRLRVISGVVMAALVLAVTWLGGFAFRIFAAAMALAIIYEWLTITAGQPWSRHHWIMSGLLAAVMAFLIAGAAPAILLALLAVALALAFVDSKLAGRGGWPPSGLAYAGLAAIALAMLRGDDNAGLWAILFLFAAVWMTDIAAYFVGRAVGGPKLAPTISPGKTWSGAVGGAVGGVLGGLVVALASGTAMGILAILALSLLLSVAAQFGDLFESLLKRRYSVKDSSNLIPGHGGVMDRVDGLVAGAVTLYVVGMLLGGFENPAQVFFAI
jgi:phosphatidate cytidylyltransferase